MAKEIRLLTKRGGFELFDSEDNHVTGFAVAEFAQGDEYVDAHTHYYYIILVRKGMIKLTCKLYNYKLISEGTMAFVPRSGKYYFTAEEDSEVIFFAFTTTIIRTDKEMLNYFCTHAAKRDYSFNTLPICAAMSDLLMIISNQIKERRMRNKRICRLWNSYFFFIMQSYYHRDDVTAFMRPIISGAVDFEAFIENNYIEAGGNVSRLAALSGLSYDTFYQKFVRIYGVTAKEWLDQRMKEQMQLLAKVPNMTTVYMASEMNITSQRLNKLCHRLWGVTPKMFIQQIKNGDVSSVES